MRVLGLREGQQLACSHTAEVTKLEFGLRSGHTAQLSLTSLSFPQMRVSILADEPAGLTLEAGLPPLSSSLADSRNMVDIFPSIYQGLRLGWRSEW